MRGQKVRSSPLDGDRGRLGRLSHGRVVLGVVFALTTGASAARAQETLTLADGWQLQSSASANADGSVVSTSAYDAGGWTIVRVPSTVVGALVGAKAPGYDLDPYWGMNLRKLPGTTYPISKNFSHFKTPADSPFARSWWYRKTFDLPAGFRGRNTGVRFDGINYRANVWLNGHKVADQADVAGTFRTYAFDLTPHVKDTGNVLAVEVFAPGVLDLALTWVDWNPMPPDRNMGLYQPVTLVASGAVSLRDPHVITHVAPSLDRARLDVSVLARNATGQEVVATVKGAIEDVAFERQVTLRAGETRRVDFDADAFRQLALPSPRLWWPYRLGKPELYELRLSVFVGDELSDQSRTRFGIREVTQELTENGALQVRVNGHPVLIRGGGWAPDMMLRQDRDRLETEMRYVKEMNENALRLEGKPESDAFYEIADREGILVLTGWCCCDQWEGWKKWTPENRWVATESLRSQIRRLRNFPSVVLWMNASDGVAPPDVERAYLDVLREERWTNAIVSSASKDKSTVTGPSGVKMNGPYDYVPPRYWLEDTTHGGAFGFNTETSPGPAIPPLETLQEILPADQLWPFAKTAPPPTTPAKKDGKKTEPKGPPLNPYWTFHAGGQEFASIDRFNLALIGRYGKPKDVADYVRKAEAMAYDGERAMFEAFGRNRRQAPGVIQWMQNNAWPSIIWHLYDYTLRPAGGFFGTKKALEPLHVQYSYDDRSIVVVNDEARDWKGLKATAAVYDLGWKPAGTHSAAVDVAGETSVKALALPEPAGRTATYFVRLVLQSSDGTELSRNFYWLSTKPDTIDYKRHDWWGAPVTQHGDFTALAALPEVVLDATAAADRATVSAGEPGLRVQVKNPSSDLAFYVRLKLTDAEGRDVKPVFWTDNYFELAPGESREVAVRYRKKDLAGGPRIAVGGWNVRSAVVVPGS
jgi:exo-1,4-beta-D-glucosaminidase